MLEPRLTRWATITPASLNVERRTAEVTWTTGARVLRAPWLGEQFYEELSLAPDHVRMARLTSGTAPVLDAHQGANTRTVIGVVESARLERGQGIARRRSCHPRLLVVSGCHDERSPRTGSARGALDSCSNPREHVVREPSPQPYFRGTTANQVAKSHQRKPIRDSIARVSIAAIVPVVRL